MLLLAGLGGRHMRVVAEEPGAVYIWPRLPAGIQRRAARGGALRDADGMPGAADARWLGGRAGAIFTCDVAGGLRTIVSALTGLSMVVAPARGDTGRIVGAIGVIGPTRINYGRIIPVVDYTARVIGRLLG